MKRYVTLRVNRNHKRQGYLLIHNINLDFAIFVVVKRYQTEYTWFKTILILLATLKIIISIIQPIEIIIDC